MAEGTLELFTLVFEYYLKRARENSQKLREILPWWRNGKLRVNKDQPDAQRSPNKLKKRPIRNPGFSFQ